MNLHNTLTKLVETISPIEGNTFRMYTCGPTVYDKAHIGNLRSYIFADTLKRTLKLAGYDVRHVMNFTDVDDKTIKRSLEKYPNLEPKEALHKLTKKNEKLFIADMRAIGNTVDDIEFVRATDMIPAMQVLITTLYEQGFAYVTEDGVYFSIEAYKKSGKLYGQLLKLDNQNTSLSRISNDEYDKTSIHDFALWKKAKKQEPFWEFKIGGHKIDGRPGWHIECSAMSSSHLGQPFDIHTGGIDLIFPHHENEIAQSTAGRDEAIYAKVFAHNEHLLVNGKKMSKSLNNFYTLADIVEHNVNPLAFRLLILQSHYRNQSNFSWDNLESAQARLSELQAFADLRWQTSKSVECSNNMNIDGIKTSMFSDLDTPTSLANLNKYADYFGKSLISKMDLGQFYKNLTLVDDLFGLKLHESVDISINQRRQIKQRQRARAQGDWQTADQIRKILLSEGIELRDYEQHTIWSRL